MDTTEHGVRISSDGDWMLVHAGTEVNSEVPVAFDEWSHVMAAIPEISDPYVGVLYVDGVAIAAQDENFSTDATENAEALIVGANTDEDGTLVGMTNHFRGVLDELKMFIWGRGYDHLTGTVTDFGRFNFAEDNDFAAGFLTGEPGDFDNDGVPVNDDSDDINAFVAGWLHEKQIDGVRVGDLTTFAMGDLNFDGITDLADARTIRQIIGGNEAGLNLAAFAAVTGVPEPSSALLAAVATSGLWLVARRRNWPNPGRS